MVEFGIRVLPIGISFTVLIITATICLTVTGVTNRAILDSMLRTADDSVRLTYDTASTNIARLSDDLMKSNQQSAQTFVLELLAQARRTAFRHAMTAKRAVNTVDTQGNIVGLQMAYAQSLAVPFSDDVATSLSNIVGYFTRDNLGIIISYNKAKNQNSGVNWMTTTEGVTFGQKKMSGRVNDVSNVVIDPDWVYATQCPLTPSVTCDKAYTTERYINTTHKATFKNYPKDAELGKADGAVLTLTRTLATTQGRLGLWTPIIEESYYIGALFTTSIESELAIPTAKFNDSVGFMMVGLDLRSISQYLANLTNIPGHRVFVSVTEDEFPAVTVPSFGDTAGILVGVSHGNEMVLVPPWKPVPSAGFPTWSGGRVPRAIKVADCTDGIIAAAGKWVNRKPQAYKSLSDDVTYLFSVEDPAWQTYGRDYFLRASKIVSGDGISWTVVVLVPYDLTLGPIDAMNRATSEKVDANKRTQAGLERDATIAISALIIAGAVGIMAAANYLTSAYMQPLIALRDDMAAVAEMNVQDVDLARPVSKITEVGSMQRSFVAMVGRLMQYKAYMPASLFAKDTDDVEVDSESDEMSLPCTPVNHSQAFSRNNSLERKASVQPLPPANLFRTLQGKNVCVLCINLKGTHNVVNAEPLFAETHAKSIEAVSAAVGCHRGVSILFFGDFYVAAFNALTRCPAKVHHACAAVFDIAATASDGFTSGASVGDAQCGDLGPVGTRAFGVVGPVVNEAMLLQRMNVTYGTRHLISGAMFREAKLDFVLRARDVIRFTRAVTDGNEEGAVAILALQARAKEGDDEWMYLLDDGDMVKDFNAIVVDMAAASSDRSRVAVADFIEKHKESEIKSVKQILEDCQRIATKMATPQEPESYFH